MKVVVRHEPATSENAPEDTCVWAIGDDGETIATAYLKEGEQVDIEVATEVKGDAEQGQIVDPSLTFGEVGPIPVPPGEEKAQADAGSLGGVDAETDQKADERGGTSPIN